MAEKGCSRDATAIVRRPSFRKTLRDNEAALPESALRQLEEKRRQLDDSIHKYIAAKEREYKQFEKDVRQQAKANPVLNGQQEAGPDVNAVEGLSRTRTSSDSMQSTASSPAFPGSSAVDALMATGLRRDAPGQLNGDGHPSSSTSPTRRRRSSAEREKDFVGLFTPSFLPAIEDKRSRQHERTSSAPGTVEPSSGNSLANAAGNPLTRAGSDTAILSRAKRPAHLQDGRRTSSSGSSIDGKLLTSVLKSQGTPLKPKKRVSLAVGDSIVAPSDNVPLVLSNSSTPSHSRSRSPVNDLDPEANVPGTSTTDFAKQPPATFALRGENTMSGLLALASEQSNELPAPGRAPAAPGLAATGASLSRSPSRIDPDGDLFDLEEESDAPIPQIEDDGLDSAMEGDDDAVPAVGGRIEPSHVVPEQNVASMSESRIETDEHEYYDQEAGVVPEPDPIVTTPVLGGEDEQAVHLEYSRGASASSQQPTSPGFRRPSVVSDPVFRGIDYEGAETRAANEEIYGSSYSRPPTKGSFTAGSLGESYMARHAEEMMRMRMAKQQQDVKS